MTPPRRAALAVAGAVLLLGKSSSHSSAIPPATPHGASIVTSASSANPPTSGALWLDAARAALDGALEVPLPFAEGGDAGAVGVTTAFAFEASAGQTLEIALERQQASDARTYVEVFRVVDVLGDELHERLAALRPSAERLRTRLPSDGTYHVLVQREDGSAGPYRLTIEVGAALPFPVPGAQADSIRSLFGASRDAGQRYHAGVDIFVQRLTPVLAVAAGRAMPRRDALGGNSVWLNTPGTSYYYAHLDRIAVRDEQEVKVGDVLGYVGNTGNARNEPSHLHFGVYRWGREPIDPLPLLVGRRFTGAAPPANLATDAG